MRIVSRPFSARPAGALRLCLAAAATAGVVTSGFAAPQAFAQAPTSTHIGPAAEGLGTRMGLESPNAPISATVWLNLHHKAELDEAVQQMYTPGSPNFHKWMTPADLRRFQPTGAELAAVQAELAAHHLTVVSSDPSNLAIKFKGQVSDFESAFHTQVGRTQLKAQVMHTVSAAPQLAGEAAGLTRSVTGVSGVPARPYHAVPVDPETGKQMGKVRVAATASPEGAYYSSQCFYAPQTIHLANAGISATYSGLVYGANPSNTQPGTVATCGYSPQDVQSIYHLNGFYGLGYQGQGETIAIVDAYGSPTIDADAKLFNQIYHLPLFTATSFHTYQPAAVTTTDAGWAGETTLDVEWAHAIAPAANIALIATASNQDDDLQLGVLYAVINKLGNVVSNSYGQPESFTDAQTMTTWDEINEFAASLGISVHYATGDEGDYAAYVEQYTGVAYPDVSVPSNSPYATAIGGTSVTFSPVDGSVLQTGWGNNITRLDYKTGEIADPPLNEGFIFGAGGGLSAYFAKPAYQKALPGAGRHLPDVSAVADPYTGVEIIFTESDGNQYYEVIGGTSLATPVFSGMWSLLNQHEGHSLGQAAPLVAAEAHLLTDIVAAPDPFNVTGSIKDATGTTKYSSVDLSEPLQGTTAYTGALYHGFSGAYYNLTFGTDSSLTVTPGWDSVTGYGSPDFGVFFK